MKAVMFDKKAATSLEENLHPSGVGSVEYLDMGDLTIKLILGLEYWILRECRVPKNPNGEICFLLPTMPKGKVSKIFYYCFLCE